MNYVIIFIKTDALSSAGINISSLSCPIKTISDTEIYLFEESTSLEEAQKNLKTALQNKKNIFYVILHTTSQKNMIADFMRVFGQNVISQSNVRGQFYYTILPKFIEKSCTLEDIKKFFPGFKISLLRKLFVGDFQLSEQELKIIRIYNFKLDEYKESYNNIPDFDALEKLKVQLVQAPLQEEKLIK
jgi:hypothetical protein